MRIGLIGQRDDISSQFSVLSSQFSVLSSQFSVLSSQFSVLSSQLGDASSFLASWMHFGNSTADRREYVHVSQLRKSFLCESSAEVTLMGESYRDLIVWRKAMQFVTDIYDATRLFPREELYGLTNQLRRASVSVPSNIAEGQARFSAKEFRHFLSHARGSLVEIETQLIIAQNLGYLSAERCRPLLKQASELGRILNGLIASINRAA